jgi:hypothetical protein
VDDPVGGASARGAGERARSHLVFKAQLHTKVRKRLTQASVEFPQRDTTKAIAEAAGVSEVIIFRHFGRTCLWAVASVDTQNGHHRMVSTDPGPPSPPGRAPSASACEPYRELIAEALAPGRNAVAIWQVLVDDHGFPARYAKKTIL